MMKMDFFTEITGINTGSLLLDEAIFNYLVHRLPPGSFALALLENNLFHAANRADYTNIENLAYIARNLSMYMPFKSCGSREAVKAWMINEDGCQSAYAEWYFEQATMKKLES